MILPLKSIPIPPQKGVYIVGGSIRDLLLGRQPIDYDIAVEENPEKFSQKLAIDTNGYLVAIGKPGKRIFRVISGERIFDVSAIHGMSILEDLGKRDFTINAMACNLSSGNMIDPFGGRQDLSAGIVRMVSPGIFRKDPVRLVRAYRLGAFLNFAIDPKTASAIQNEGMLIEQTAGERIREELFNLFRTPRSHRYVSQMVETGLLFRIFPELKGCTGLFQNNLHAYDVFQHTMKALFHLEALINDVVGFMTGTQKQYSQWLNDRRSILLKWAILFHDVGKPAAKSVGKNGRIHFFDHAGLSADHAKRIAKRLKFSTRDTKYVDRIIQHHMQPLSLFTAAESGIPINKGLSRFFRKCGDEAPGVVLHAVADMHAKVKNGDSKAFAFKEFAKEMMQKFFLEFVPLSSRPPLITGDDLISECKLTPSPLFKTILRQVEEERLLKKIKTRTEALEYVKNILEKKVRETGVDK
jgi:tRNA nucleotidyltransferase/poly(A) polymerase